MKNYSASEHINIGTGKETSIAQFAETIRSVVGFEGAIEYDATRPDGAPRKLLDIGALAALGWTAQISLPEGLRSEEHTSELQSLMRISYAVFCLKKKKNNNHKKDIQETKTINKKPQDNKHPKETI